MLALEGVDHRQATVRWGSALAAFLALLATTTAASAHALGLSRGDYTLEGRVLRAQVVLRSDEAALAVSGLDADGDGRVSRSEADRARPALQAAFVDSTKVLADGSRCPGTLDAVTLDAPDGLRLGAAFDCAGAPTRIRVHLGFLERFSSSHRHLATLHLPRGDVDALASFDRPDLEALVADGPSHGTVSLLRSGIEHILTGADHLAFLLAIVLGGTRPAPGAGRRIRAGPLVAMLTAFTVGHSLSLGVATLAGLAPGARLVEPAVALSVAYVGAENLFSSDLAHRWRLTLLFGFVHGFAFAGGLIPLGLPRAELPLALFAFNLGVEIGQLLVLAVLLPPLAWLRSRAWYPRAVRTVSAAIVLAGVVWFVRRVA